METTDKKAHEKLKEEMSKYFKARLIKSIEKLKENNKTPKESLAEIIQEPGDVFKNIIKDIVKEISEDYTDLRIVEKIEGRNKKQAISYINEFAKDRGREMSQKQLIDPMKEHSRRHIDKDIDVIVQDHLKKQIRSQVNERLKNYANTCVQSKIDIKALEKYAEDRTEDFVMENIKNMAYKGN